MNVIDQKVTRSSDVASRLRHFVIEGAANFPMKQVLAGVMASVVLAGADARAQGDLSFLSFSELVALSTTAMPQGALADKVTRLLTTPIVDNGPGRDIQPHRPTVDGLGTVLRVAFWNIERGRNAEAIRLAFTDARGFHDLAASGSQRVSTAPDVDAELRILQDADILVLNEVDVGMKRTAYRDVARKLATALGMSYAYAVEFIEVDPLFDLGLESVALPSETVQRRIDADLAVDHDRYRGLHGNAILSRYPIRDARIIRLPVGYDWYAEEAKAISRLEKGKRRTAAMLFNERVKHELRHGGRVALVADLDVPDIPTGRVTVVSVHLENRCAPACRRRQMEALVEEVGNVRHPVILAGDLNTSGSDATPTSVPHEIMQRVWRLSLMGRSGDWIRQPAVSSETAIGPNPLLPPASRPDGLAYPLRVAQRGARALQAHGDVSLCRWGCI